MPVCSVYLGKWIRYLETNLGRTILFFDKFVSDHFGWVLSTASDFNFCHKLFHSTKDNYRKIFEFKFSDCLNSNKMKIAKNCQIINIWPKSNRISCQQNQFSGNNRRSKSVFYLIWTARDPKTNWLQSGSVSLAIVAFVSYNSST